MKIKVLNGQDDSHHPQRPASVFHKPALRRAFAREYRLQAVDVLLPFNGTSLTLPAFQSPDRKRLILGAGFDKTGLFQWPNGYSYMQVIAALAEALQETACCELEVRSTHWIPCARDYSDKVNLLICLNQPAEQLLMQLSKYCRRDIRKPFKRGYDFKVGRTREDLQVFYQLYYLAIHRLGSLAHSWRFFYELWQSCGEDLSIYIGYMDGQAVVAVLLLETESELYAGWSGTHPDYKKQAIPSAMIWSLAEYAERCGKSVLNLGRSSVDSGAYVFKRRFANTEQKLYYYRFSTQAPQQTKYIRNAAARLIRNSPPWVMDKLSRALIHRFY